MATGTTQARDSSGEVEPVVSTAVYVASRASLSDRPEMWRSLRDEGWNITSTWINEYGPGETEDWTELWQRIASEVKESDGVVLYAEHGDFPLKGAFIECGMALGMNKPVAVVMVGFDLREPSFRPVGSWVNHPLCRLCSTLEEAREWISTST